MNRALYSISTGAALVAILFAAPARADVEFAERDGWKLSLDGRLNSFVSHAFGSGIPDKIPDYTGVDDEKTADNDIISTRLRTGFIASVLAFNLRKKVTDRFSVWGRVGMWVLAASSRAKNDIPPVDVREVFLKIEGPWGGLLAGRNMSLFPRGHIMMNYFYGHAYGLGHPCNTQIVSGGACGHAGHGTPFPGFNSGIVYNTPDNKPLQLSVGAFDPSTIPVGQYERTPYPRFEAEVTARLGKVLHLFGNGFWQVLSRTRQNMMTNMLEDQDADASGAGGGVGVEMGPLRLGGAAYFGQGLGMYLPVENNPVTVDEEGVLRKSNGFYGQAALVLNRTQISAGVGVSQMNKTENDKDPEKGQNPQLIKQHLGMSAGVYHRIDPVVLAIEYFRAEYKWHEYGEPDPEMPQDLQIVLPQQAVNFINAGLTLYW